MIQTFDWIIKASREPALKRMITCCMEKGDGCITIDRFTITFSKDTAIASVRKRSNDIPMASKIISAEIPYRVLNNMLEGNWHDLSGIHFPDE